MSFINKLIERNNSKFFEKEINFDPKKFDKNIGKNNRLSKKRFEILYNDFINISTYENADVYYKQIDKNIETNAEKFEKMCNIGDGEELKNYQKEYRENYSWAIAEMISLCQAYGAYFMISNNIKENEAVLNRIIHKNFWIYDTIIYLSLKYFINVDHDYVAWNGKDFLATQDLKNKELLQFISRTISNVARLTNAINSKDSKAVYECFCKLNMEQDFLDLNDPFEL